MPAKSPKNEKYLETFNEALDDLRAQMSQREDLDAQREEMDRRISRLREAAFGLGGLCGMARGRITADHPDLFPEHVQPEVGFTDAVKLVFRKHSEAQLSPVFIRDSLVADGFDISKYTNVLASIHSIVKRLKLKGDVLVDTREGKTVYRLNPRSELAKLGHPDDVPF